MPWYFNCFAFILCQVQKSNEILSADWAGVIVAVLALAATIFSTLWQINEGKKAEKARSIEAEKLQLQRDTESREAQIRRVQDLERLELQRAEDQLKVAEARRLNIRADWFKNQIYLSNKEAFDKYFTSINHNQPKTVLRL